METRLDDGLELYKINCPIGVIGIVFESRPDALDADIYFMSEKWK